MVKQQHQKRKMKVTTVQPIMTNGRIEIKLPIMMMFLKSIMKKGARNLNMSKENKFILIGLISTILLGIILVFPLINTLKKNAAVKERIEYLEKRQTKPSYKDGEVIEIGGFKFRW